MLLSSRRFQFGHPVENFSQKFRNSFFKISKHCPIYDFLRKKLFVSKWFSGHMKCGVENSAKIFRHEAGFFLLITQRSKCFGFSQIFFLEMLTLLAITFAKKLESQLNIRKKTKVVFFSKKNQLHQRFSLDAWNGVFTALLKFFLQKNGIFSLIFCLGVKMFWFSPKVFTRNVPLNTKNAFLVLPFFSFAVFEDT